MRLWILQQLDLWQAVVMAVGVFALVIATIAAGFGRNGSFMRGAGVFIGGVALLVALGNVDWFVSKGQEDVNPVGPAVGQEAGG